VYSTYLGGNDAENDFRINHGGGIAVDAAGNAYVTGSTWSPDFPTVNPVQGTAASVPDAFVGKLNSSGSSLVFSTFLGGSDYDDGSRLGDTGVFECRIAVSAHRRRGRIHHSAYPVPKCRIGVS